MIASLHGTVVAVESDRAVLMVGGLGFEVFAAARTLARLSRRVGEDAELTTYLHVREDALQLYGFESARERGFFLSLTGVSGVGPRVALSVLSGYPVDELEVAIARDDVKKFESIPGIGKKLAQRLVVELKDVVGKGVPVPVPAGDGGVDRFVAARSALQNLGLSLREAEEALRGAPPDAPLEELVRFALSRGTGET
jgi:holliday junction DNA helicase RuvA